METLPAEIIAMISEYIPKSQLKVLRRWNHTLATGVTPRLFDSVDATFSPETDMLNSYMLDEHFTQDDIDDFYGSRKPCGNRPIGKQSSAALRKLCRIAGDPSLAKQVKSLAVGSDKLYLWQYYREKPYEREWARTAVPQIDLYLQRLERTLAFALPKLHSLQDVSIQGLCPFNSGGLSPESRNKEWRSCMRRAADVVLTHFSHSSRRGRLKRWTQHALMIYSWHGYNGYFLTENVTCVLGGSQLFVDETHPWDSDRLLNPEPLQSLQSPLRSTTGPRRLSFECDHAGTSGSAPAIQLPVHLALPLESSELSGSTFHSASATPRSFILKQHCLRTLKLEAHEDITSEHLMEILSSNAASLRAVHLKLLLLKSGTWSSIFTYMTENVTQLGETCLHNLAYAEKDAVDHLRHRSIEDDAFVGVIMEQRKDLRSADATEFGVLDQLYEVVKNRSGGKGNESVDGVLVFDEADAFGPEKRKYTLLDKWLGIPAM